MHADGFSQLHQAACKREKAIILKDEHQASQRNPAKRKPLFSEGEVLGPSSKESQAD